MEKTIDTPKTGMTTGEIVGTTVAVVGLGVAIYNMVQQRKLAKEREEADRRLISGVAQVVAQAVGNKA